MIRIYQPFWEREDRVMPHVQGYHLLSHTAMATPGNQVHHHYIVDMCDHCGSVLRDDRPKVDPSSVIPYSCQIRHLDWCNNCSNYKRMSIQPIVVPQTPLQPQKVQKQFKFAEKIEEPEEIKEEDDTEIGGPPYSDTKWNAGYENLTCSDSEEETENETDNPSTTTSTTELVDVKHTIHNLSANETHQMAQELATIARQQIPNIPTLQSLDLAERIHTILEKWAAIPSSSLPGLAISKQEGGSHYRKLTVQPVEYIQANNLDFFQGNVIKYITRHKEKGGVLDVRKARHYCEMIEELQYPSSPEKAQPDTRQG